MIKILIVGGEQLTREGLSLIISSEPDMEIIGSASDEQVAFAISEKIKTDIALIEVDTLSADVIIVMKKMLDTNQELKVIFITNNYEEDLVMKGILKGVQGFLSIEIDGNRLIRSIRNVYGGQTVLTDEASRLVVGTLPGVKDGKKQALENKLMARGISLTSGELDVAYLVMKSTQARKIAETLFISKGTVENYMRALYNKLNLNKRSDVVDYLQGVLPQTDINLPNSGK